MISMKTIKLTMAALAVAFAGNVVAQGKPANMGELLELVKQGKTAEAAESKQREQDFRNQRGKQQELLGDARNRRSAQERRSETLETNFEDNELLIADKTEALTKRLGSLKELFGVLQQVSGDTRGIFESSLISSQYPDRGLFLTDLAKKMGTSSELATIEEMERLWFEIQREMTESGNVARYSTEVIGTNGEKAQREVIRVGTFNLISDGAYLSYIPDTGNIIELARQPQDRFVETASALSAGSSGLISFGLDPTRGSLLAALIQSPDLKERVNQGGIVGYVIISVGMLGLLIALERLLVLSFVSAKVSRQLKSDKADIGNPLGRVLKVHEENLEIDVESLELKLGEAILREMPKLSRGVMIIKIIGVIAPLMGLLGTVTGMIKTFQAITLYGAGDPKLMAGGISQALVTTVLGLCVAIPMVLLHTVVAGRSKRITHVLQEQSAGIIAEQMERTQARSGQTGQA
jgi:biopolymer transport protein ExbB